VVRLRGFGSNGDRTATAMRRRKTLLQVLQKLWDPTFSEHSYGFRPGRSAHQAVAQAQTRVAEGYCHVVDIDLERSFDRVNHDIVMARVAKRVSDKRVLKLIRAFLNARVMEDPRDHIALSAPMG